MQKLRIRGGRPLAGDLPVSGAKNSALPALAAALLTADEVTLGRIPAVRDIRTMTSLLSSVGAAVELDDGVFRIRAARIERPEAPYELVKTMRASSLVLGPLAARCGRARVSLPGGCAIGARPVNLHVEGLQALGATVTQEAGYIEAVAPSGGLRGGRYAFPRVTVTGTEDLLMAAVLARGETVLENAAREPEVADLGALLTKMGASISGAGESTIRIQGVNALHGARHDIIADRIEAGTYLVAGALLGEKLRIVSAEAAHLGAVLGALERAGADIEREPGRSLLVQRHRPIRPVDITTEVYPGFPTDMQAQWMALMAFADGVSLVTETIFENRFMHIGELLRMGARIEPTGNSAAVTGSPTLSGAKVMASDLRASACLVLAAMAAEGETVIDRIYHLDRGYENLEGKLSAVGADIERID